MKNSSSTFFAIMIYLARLMILCLMWTTLLAQELPTSDRRAVEIRHLNLKYDFTPPNTKEGWLARAEYLRGQILFSSGLWPLPEKTPLNAKIFGKVEKEDYTVEKVYFESYPGHYVTGNLYKPKSIAGKAPAILCPHGHWAYGRLEHQQLNSGPARAANLARQGYIAFAWDMVGYNDSSAIPHTFASHKEGLPIPSLWGINLLGLQLWNSIRAVDFVLSLPEVDANRLGVTGESGGATQTFLLAAVDERIKATAPVNMISSIMQGGSECENAPLLRIDTNNMELGALTAPRPMLMVAATGDWTKTTPQVEFPAVQKVYRLFDEPDKVSSTQFEAPHNYNQASREAVYGWFAHWFQGRQEATALKEKSYNIPTLSELMVFYGLPRPASELNEKQLTERLIEARKKQAEDAFPKDAAGLNTYKMQFGRGFKYSIMAEMPRPEEVISTVKNPPGIILLSRRGQNDLISLKLVRPAKVPKLKQDSYVLLVSLESEFVSGAQELMNQLLAAGHTVAFLTCYPGPSSAAEPNKYKFLTTYNRTDNVNRIQDILTAVAYLNKTKGANRLSVVGLKDAGVLTLLARGLAGQVDRMVIDAAQFENTGDEDFLSRVAIPGIRRAGDFTTAIALAPLTPLLIQNTGEKFHPEKMLELYRTFGQAGDFQAQSRKMTDAEIVTYLSLGGKPEIPATVKK